jgi:hypothetical protein
MSEHRLFYFPYGSFTDAQVPLLKVAALYFDKLVLLDPVGASWDTVGADTPASDAVKTLRAAGLLETVTPAAVLADHAAAIAEEVRRDMADAEFLALCDSHAKASGKRRWTLALAKLPQDLTTDQAMRHLMGDFAREVSAHTAAAAADYVEHVEAMSYLPRMDRPFPQAASDRALEYRSYSEMGEAYDELRGGYEGEPVEYRYADFPLELGEAIMLNHALFAGLLHSQATPMTDDAFHSRALALKLRRAAQQPAIRQVLADRARAQEVRADLLGVATLTDQQLDLPVLNPALPLEEVLSYREQHASELEEARKALGWIARRIETEPWTDDFAADIEHKAIPDVAAKLDEARRARDAWVGSQRGRLAISAAGIATGAAGAVLAVVAAPVTPIAIAIAATSLASGSVLPGMGWLRDWRDGKRAAQENGLHYLLNVPSGP